MEILTLGIAVAALCWFQHVKANRRPISWQEWHVRMRKLDANPELLPVCVPSQRPRSS